MNPDAPWLGEVHSTVVLQKAKVIIIIYKFQRGKGVIIKVDNTKASDSCCRMEQNKYGELFWIYGPCWTRWEAC